MQALWKLRIIKYAQQMNFKHNLSEDRMIGNYWCMNPEKGNQPVHCNAVITLSIFAIKSQKTPRLSPARAWYV